MKVGIVMGSISDKPIGKKYGYIKKFDVDYEIKVISAHRTPDIAVDFANAESNNIEVIIAIAGKAATFSWCYGSITPSS